MNNEICILVHGFSDSSKEMSFLQKGLIKRGFKTISVNLPTTFGDFQECLDSLELQIYDIINKYDKVNYIAHSMGGLLVRNYIKNIKQNNVKNCIFIATPHKGTALANILKNTVVIPQILPTINNLLVNNNLDLLLDKKIKIGLIAGNKSTPLGYFLNSENDGRVEVSSVKYEDSDDFIVLPYTHKGILKSNETLIKVINFLSKGMF